MHHTLSQSSISLYKTVNNSIVTKKKDKTKEYFSELKMVKADVTTVIGIVKLTEGSGKAHIILPNRTKLVTNDSLYTSK